MSSSTLKGLPRNASAQDASSVAVWLLLQVHRRNYAHGKETSLNETTTAEKTALTVGFWLLFTGGVLGIVMGFAWLVSGKRPLSDYATVGIGGAATVALSAVVAFVRSRL